MHKIKVNCCLNISSKCKNNYEICDREHRRQIKNNFGVYCLYCSRELKSSGRKNPNVKYNFNDNYMEKIDTPHKAYLLGWIASDGSLARKDVVCIYIKSIDEQILQILKNKEFRDIPIQTRKNDMVGFSICSKKIHNDCCYHLQIQTGKKSNCVKFPILKDGLYLHFIRGYFEGDGSVHTTKSLEAPRCSISSNSKDMLLSIKEYIGLPGNISGSNLEFSGVNCLDFLHKIYENNLGFRLDRKYSYYQDISLWQPSLNKRYVFEGAECCKTDKNAFIPIKKRASDSGFDIYLIKKIKDFGNGTQIFDTCLKVKPPFGYYFDLVPRSSFYKTGYILLNSVGVIDRNYCGSIMVVVNKIDRTTPDLELPGRYFQIIPREIVHFNFIEVNELDETERGEQGFGSSGR